MVIRVRTFSVQIGDAIVLNKAASTLTRHENEAFRKHASKPEEFETLGSRLHVDVKHFLNELYENDDVTMIT